MTAPANPVAQTLRHMAALYREPGLIERDHRDRRQQRDEVQIVREVQAACSALATATTSWSTFLPRPAAVEAARSTVQGLARLLAELAALQAEGRRDG